MIKSEPKNPSKAPATLAGRKRRTPRWQKKSPGPYRCLGRPHNEKPLKTSPAGKIHQKPSTKTQLKVNSANRGLNRDSDDENGDKNARRNDLGSGAECRRKNQAAMAKTQAATMAQAAVAQNNRRLPSAQSSGDVAQQWGEATRRRAKAGCGRRTCRATCGAQGPCCPAHKGRRAV